jgi:RND family efflux transporter MFP subunit
LLLLTLAILAFLSLPAIYYVREVLLPARAALPSIPTARVRTGTLKQSIRLTGATAAERGALLRAPYLRGRRSRGGSRDFEMTLSQLAGAGTRVKRGEIVAVFDRLNMGHRLDDVRAERFDAEESLEKLRADQAIELAAHDQLILVAKAHRETARLDLKTAPVRSAIEVESFRLTLEEADLEQQSLLAQRKYLLASQAAQFREAELMVEEAELEERQAQANLDRMIVRAPADGLVVLRETRRGGEYGQIQEGDQVRPGQPYLQIVDTGSIVVEATASQVDVTRLRLGAPVRVNVDAYPDLRLRGRIHSISPMANPSRWRGSFVSDVPVVIDVEDRDSRLIPSLSVSADVVTGSEPDAGIVPRAAVFHDEDGDPYAYVKTADGWEKRDLELGMANNVAVAVRSGVEPGETVALASPQSL